MRLGRESIAALADATTTSCVTRCVERVRELFPERAQGVEELELLRRLRAIVDRLQTLGFEHTGDIERAAPLMYAIRYRAAPADMPDDLRASLSDPRSTTETKIEALEQLLMFGPEAS
jgi:hypothetical protein